MFFSHAVRAVPTTYRYPPDFSPQSKVSPQCACTYWSRQRCDLHWGVHSVLQVTGVSAALCLPNNSTQANRLPCDSKAQFGFSQLPFVLGLIPALIHQFALAYPVHINRLFWTAHEDGVALSARLFGFAFHLSYMPFSSSYPTYCASSLKRSIQSRPT